MCNQTTSFEIEKQQISGKSILFHSAKQTPPLKIGLINLMPQKEVTEEQFFRLLSNTGQAVEVKLIKMETYHSTTTNKAHLEKYYHTLPEIEAEHFDGLIITGAPIETLPFEAVDYWEELTQILTWSQSKLVSTLNICWGAQAALYHYYGVNKFQYPEKLSGVFVQEVEITNPLMSEIPKEFSYPQSRHTGIELSKIIPDTFQILAQSQALGPTIFTSDENRNIYILGHLEYDTETLKKEYERDMKRNLSPNIPENYFEKDDPSQKIQNIWGEYAEIFYQNWLEEIQRKKASI